jgi:hypothetical protein
MDELRPDVLSLTLFACWWEPCKIVPSELPSVTATCPKAAGLANLELARPGNSCTAAVLFLSISCETT